MINLRGNTRFENNKFNTIIINDNKNSKDNIKSSMNIPKPLINNNDVDNISGQIFIDSLKKYYYVQVLIMMLF